MTAKSVADPNFMMLRLVAALPINRHGLQARSIHFLAKPLGLISADRHRCASLGISRSVPDGFHKLAEKDL
jgi:hypothetical protein